MKVLFTLKLKQQQELELKHAYPTITFYFNGSVEDSLIDDVAIIITFGTDITPEVLDRAKSLKWIMVFSAGVDTMPLAHISEKRILMTNVSGIHKTPMAESVLAHILALGRSIPEIYKLQKTKIWRTKVNSVELKGSTALILGTGMIGSEIGRLLQAFGVRTIGYNRSGRENEFMDEVIVGDQLKVKLSEADFVISLLPSTNETRSLFTKTHFESMKNSAVFMNFGRGDIVEEKVLIRALKNEEIKHAVLDVFEVEPLHSENELWTLENCTVSPHISSKSGKYVERSLEIFKKNLTLWLNDEVNLVNVVNSERGY